MIEGRRETLVLTLPHDPGLARLTRRVTLHFLVQNGIAAGEARRGARAVEARCEALLKAAPAGRRRASLIVTLASGGARLEVFGRNGVGGARSRLVRLDRPARS